MLAGGEVKSSSWDYYICRQHLQPGRVSPLLLHAVHLHSLDSQAGGFSARQKTSSIARLHRGELLGPAHQHHLGHFQAVHARHLILGHVGQCHHHLLTRSVRVAQQRTSSALTCKLGCDARLSARQVSLLDDLLGVVVVW